MIYLIDTENVHNEYHIITQIAGDPDMLYLFYSAYSDNTSMANLNNAITHGIGLRFFKCETGTNAMDFQIVSYLGYLIATHPDDYYVIVSDDGGYDPAIKFWKDRGAHVMRFPYGSDPGLLPWRRDPAQIQEELRQHLNPPEDARPKRQLQDIYRDIIMKSVNIGPENAEAIASVMLISMDAPKSKRRVNTYNALCSKLGQSRGRALYRRAKEPIMDIANNGPYPETVKPNPDDTENLSDTNPDPSPAAISPQELQIVYKRHIKAAKSGLTNDQANRCAAALYRYLRLKKNDPSNLKQRFGSILGPKAGQSLADKLRPVITQLIAAGFTP